MAVYVFIFIGLRKKIVLAKYINLVATHEKKLYYNKIIISEGIDIDKSNKSCECMICHYWYFLNLNHTYGPYVCNGCHDISMMIYELENVAMQAFIIDVLFGIWPEMM